MDQPVLHVEHVPIQDGMEGGVSQPDDVDIIAVQGLASNPQTTWTAYDDKRNPCMWLRDLLPQDLPKARIQTFRYDSRWYEDPDYVSLRECGKRLLYALIADRTHRGQHEICPTRRHRPLILIGHSFGGLVISQFLILASQVQEEDDEFRYENCQNILKATSAIIFLGVPFRGSKFAKWGLRKAWMENLRGKQTYTDNLKILAVESVTLAELRESFRKLFNLTVMANTMVFCFYETKGISTGIVVDSKSACLDFATPDGLAANHFEMNKFSAGDNYNRVIRRLKISAEAAPRIVQERFQQSMYGDPQSCPEYKIIASVLDIAPSIQKQALDSILSRRDADTCHWISTQHILGLWSDFKSNDNIAWAFGIPGSGKSVLAASIIESHWTRSNTCSNEMSDESCGIAVHRNSLPCIAYYFAGFGRERFEVTAVLSTLVDQCLRNYREHRKLFVEIGKLLSKYTQQQQRRNKLFVDMLNTITRLTGGIRIVIDGFNELEHWLELIDILFMLRSNKKIRVLFLGHPNDQPIGKSLANISSNGMAFDISDYTRDDLELFVQKNVAKYRHQGPAHVALANDMESFLLKNSHGMYQWVSLVLDVIERYGDSVSDARGALAEFPTGLLPMYAKVFEKLACRPLSVLNRAKKALWFLAVKLSPISLGELQAYVDLAPEKSEKLEDLQAEHERTDHLAALNLRGFLGSLVIVRQEPSGMISSNSSSRVESIGNDSLVELCHSSLRQLILGQSSLSLNFRDRTIIAEFSINSSQAHFDVSMACVRFATYYFRPIICSSYYSLKDHRPYLAQYAYENWFTHLLATDKEHRESLQPEINEFRKELITGSIALLGSISLSISSQVAELGPQMGGITNTAGIIALEIAARRAAKDIAVLASAPFDLTYTFLHKPAKYSSSTLSLLEELRGWYRRWQRNNYYSSVALQVTDLDLKGDSNQLSYRRYIDYTVDAVQSLQQVASEITINPVSPMLLQPRSIFSPCAPFLLAAHALESIMLWPFPDVARATSSAPWSHNMLKNERANAMLSYAADDVFSQPSDAERRRRKKVSERWYTVSGSKFLTVGVYLMLNEGSGLTGYVRRIFLSQWLKIRVHVRSGYSILCGNPISAWTSPRISPSLDAVYQYTIPKAYEVFSAFPLILILNLAAQIREALKQVHWSLGLALQMQYWRLRSGYVNYARILPSLWLDRRPFIIPALTLYVLRCRYFPNFGQHWRPNAYAQIQQAIVAPLDWVYDQSSWTWYEWAEFHLKWGAVTLFSSSILFVSRNSRNLYNITQLIHTTQFLFILERTVCQIVGAVLSLTVPIHIMIQPEFAHEPPQETLIDLILYSIRADGNTLFLKAAFVIAFPMNMWYFGQLSMLRTLKSILVPMIMSFALSVSIVVLVFASNLLARPSLIKEPADAFLTSLGISATIFLVLHLESRFINDPWNLDITLRGYKKVVRIARQFTGQEVLSLDAFIDRQRTSYQKSDAEDQPWLLSKIRSHEQTEFRHEIKDKNV